MKDQQDQPCWVRVGASRDLGALKGTVTVTVTVVKCGGCFDPTAWYGTQ